MDVCDEHRVEVFGREARGAQILWQPSHRIDGGGAAARVDKNRVAVSLNDKGVDRQPRGPSRNAPRISPWKSSRPAPLNISKLMSRKPSLIVVTSASQMRRL